MVAMYLCNNGDVHHPDADLTKALVGEAFKRQLLLLSCGSYGNVLRLMLPLTIPDKVLDEGMEILEAALATAVSA